ncbi:MAG: APC family permease [Alphaproteobacteria bacterium]
MTAEPTLKRSLTLPMITLYGLGTTIGAGIYVLVGKVAGEAGLYAPAAFIVASLMAAFTALSFAELSGRFPISAGAAIYVHAGIGLQSLATLVGLLVVTAGIVSSGAIIHGFVGYLHEFIAVPDWLIIVAIALLLGAIAGWGITESVLTAALITLVEIGGLLAIILGGYDRLPEAVTRFPEFLPPFEGAAWLGILAGAVLAFYAFIGFEDMVNVAEEVKDVRRNLPLAILLTLGVTTLLYLLVCIIAIVTLPASELATSEAPLARIFEETTGMSSTPISLIAIVAVLNGALIQIIMASRVLYGMACRGWLPVHLSRVHALTRTPLVATAFVTGVLIVLTLWLPLATLAEATSVVTLIVFTLVNVSLIRIKRREPVPADIWTAPLWVPFLGALISGGFVLFRFIVSLSG